jgi:hypothetical protein
MTKTILVRPANQGSDKLRLSPAITGRPPYLRGESVGLPYLSTAAREEVRLAQEELGKWQDAFDGHRQGDPDEYRMEIRTAEKRLRSAFSSIGGRKTAAHPLVPARFPAKEFIA